jgi:hypothetical protein
VIATLACELMLPTLVARLSVSAALKLRLPA